MLGSLASPSSSSLEGTNKAEQHVNLKSRSLHSASHKQQPQQPIYSKGKLADSRYAKSYTHPSVTLKDLRDAVPSHCFERNMVTSFTHLFKDLVMAAFLVLANYQIQSFLSHGQDQFWSFILSGLAWCFYWVAQGIICTGIWVLAHECGHGAFTKSSLVNNVTGYILHTALLVPFFSWKYTHSKHHKGTNHMLKDQVYVPLTRSRIEKANGLSPSSTPFSSSETTTTNPFEHESDSLLEDAPLTYLFNLAAMLLLGWPLYLVLNKASQKNRKGAWTNHFNPNAFIFEDNERFFVALSSVGVLGMLCLLSWCGVRFGFGNVIVWYGIPYLWVNAWLVLITYLQHSDPRVPKYRGKEWTFFRGALGTVDRDFGWVLNFLFHHITDTHVVHHLFSTMPFYHAQEATEAVKKVLGDHYLFDDTHFVSAALVAQRRCRFVEDEGDLVWFKH